VTYSAIKDLDLHITGAGFPAVYLIRFKWFVSTLGGIGFYGFHLIRLILDVNSKLTI
jgi:hypothetical protein